MNSKFDYDLLSAMMTNANMGWWEADLKTESYICSEYISRLLGLDEDGTINGILPHIPSTISGRHKRLYICSTQ